jgi:4a-hydroxytetrahydrobiopterin dehydratase
MKNTTASKARMSKLHKQDCNNLSEDLIALKNDDIPNHLQQLNAEPDSQWQFNNEDITIYNTYSFKNYYQTMAFVNVVAQIAHQQDHHPDLQVSYNRCTVIYSTHSVGGISVKDFICAAKINAALNL